MIREWFQLDFEGGETAMTSGEKRFVATRIGQPQWERLVIERIQRNTSNSAILEEALDDWLRKNGWDGK